MLKISNRNKAVLMVLSAALCFTGMNACVRLAGDLPFIQKGFFRNFVAAIFAAVTLFKSHTPFKIEKGCGLPMFLRAACGTAGLLCNFYAVDHLDLADASMLNKLSPFFAVIFSALFLKEKTDLKQTLAIILAFVGSLFIIRPSFTNMEFFPSVIGFLGGMGAGSAYTCVRYMGKHRQNGTVIVLFFSLFSCVVTLPFVIIGFVPMTAKQLFTLLLAGLFAAGGQFSITGAYTYAPASEVSVFDYSQVIFSAVLGFFLFSQLPSLLSYAGYAIIILAAVWMYFYNNKKDNKSVQ